MKKSNKADTVSGIAKWVAISQLAKESYYQNHIPATKVINNLRLKVEKTNKMHRS